MPNGTGIALREAADSNIIGGAVAGDANVISNSADTADTTTFGDGIRIEGGDSNTVTGNLVGTGPDGDTDAGNRGGLGVDSGATGNLIGGAAADARNVISGSALSGVSVSGASTTGNRFEGNRIGTDVTGAFAIENGRRGFRSVAAPPLTRSAVTRPARET